MGIGDSIMGSVAQPTWIRQAEGNRDPDVPIHMGTPHNNRNPEGWEMRQAKT
eukprot:CAMPEP_0184681470 /NCGR_PEP_ID=MMETSP0312-20130426/4469_1 /TAXON_ID=31354 /ORGANISM="Compsopogon coeruleus, Strain SAG 36.94" /LENGTH=51 /DNA_ID=CAMNT_0027132351 /DNA_START=52 /DNA_END=203 /DNA_ORIENTATION=-